MKLKFRRLAWTSLLLSGVLLTPSFAGGSPDRVALEAAIHRWVAAVNAPEADALITTLTPDVELLDGHASAMKGRKAAIAVLREVAARGRLVAHSREITIAGDLAWHVVDFTQVQENGDVQARGQGLEIWRRVNGEWQLHRQLAPALRRPESALTRPSPTEPVLDQPKN